jgi:oligoribonuclease NrnB/cAMP/cGMP phosphodiesterase (DHH superfamily)
MNMKRITFNYVIYHKSCIDGFTGLIIALRSGLIDANAIIYADVPSTYNVPPNIKNMNVLIIDVAYRINVLKDITSNAKYVVFIDHHITSHDTAMELKNKNDNLHIVYDEKKSGASLTWHYFHPKEKVPVFVKYIEDNDIGAWKHEKTKPFILAIKTIFRINEDEDNIKKWDKLFDKNNVANLVKIGKYMKNYNDYLTHLNLPRHPIERFPSKKVYDMNPSLFKKIGMYKVAVFCGMNCPSVSDLSTLALERLDCDFCIMWTYGTDNKKYVLSMRSKKVNVAKICELFDGGGHKLASACSFNSNKLIIDDLFHKHD